MDDVLLSTEYDDVDHRVKIITERPASGPHCIDFNESNYAQITGNNEDDFVFLNHIQSVQIAVYNQYGYFLRVDKCTAERNVVYKIYIIEPFIEDLDVIVVQYHQRVLTLIKTETDNELRTGWFKRILRIDDFKTYLEHLYLKWYPVGDLFEPACNSIQTLSNFKSQCKKIKIAPYRDDQVHTDWSPEHANWYAINIEEAAITGK